MNNKELGYYSNPFSSGVNESIETKRKILRLDGIKATEDGWTFIDQENQKTYSAEVLDKELQGLARNEPINTFSKRDLYCEVREKHTKKENKKNYTTKRFIISFSFKDTEKLF